MAKLSKKDQKKLAKDIEKWGDKLIKELEDRAEYVKKMDKKAKSKIISNDTDPVVIYARQLLNQLDEILKELEL